MNCFLWMCLAGLYVEGGVGYIDVPENNIEPWAVALVHNKPRYALTGVRMHDYNQGANPMGRIAIGYEWNPSASVRIDLQLRHESWIASKKDRGTNSAWASVRAFPFRH